MHSHDSMAEELLDKFCNIKICGSDNLSPNHNDCKENVYYSLLCFLILIVLTAYAIQPRRDTKHFFRRGIHFTLCICSGMSFLAAGIALVLSTKRSSSLFEVVTSCLSTICWMFYMMLQINNTRKHPSFFTLDFRLCGVGLFLINLHRSLHIFIERKNVESFLSLLSLVSVLSSSPIAVISVTYWPRSFSASVQEPRMDTIGSGISNPFRYSSYISKIWYSWFTPTLLSGYRRQLQADDVFDLEEGMYVGELRPLFVKAWLIENERSNGNPSLIRVLWSCFYKNILHAVALKASYDALSFAPPLLLNELLKWIQRSDERIDDSRAYGYIIAALMVLAIFILPILENSYFFVVYRTGIKSRSCLVDAVQRKALLITPGALDKIGTGTIMNHMTKDSEMLERVFNSINYLWSAPIRIIIALYLLNRLVGYAAFMGFLTILLVFPLQGTASKFVAMYRKSALKLNDQRVGAMSEIINGIKIIKFYGWEESRLLQVFAIRAEELKKLLKLAYCSSVNIVLFNINPILIAIVVFAVHSCYGTLSANIAFTALSLIDIVRFPMMMLPGCITMVIEARIALRRLSKYLSAEEIAVVQSSGAALGSIALKNVSVKGNEDCQYRIKNINLTIAPGMLVSIIGKTGCGKSTLVDSLVGAVASSGEISVDGTISYVTQQAWIINDTAEENIVFGCAYDGTKLSETLRTCQLRKDVLSWPGGLHQEIGERGMNLSGGQKQRVSLARAVYSESDIILLDDPLASLDAKVGHDVFMGCILGTLKRRTRLFVTSQIHFLEYSDWVIFMEEGEIQCQGTYSDLLKTSPSFVEFTQATNSKEREEMVEASHCDENLDIVVGPSSYTQHRQTDEEYRRQGTSFTWECLTEYFKAAGGTWVLVLAVSFFAIRQILNILSAWWLSKWAGNVFQYRNRIWVMGYGLFGFAQAIMEFFMAIFIANRGVNAAQNMHNAMLMNLIHLPMVFYDRNPSGRILNRVTKDQANMDEGLTWQLNVTMKLIFGVIGTISAITFVSPLFLLVAIPVLITFYWIQIFYRASVRELKRLESTTRSPIYSVFSETLAGANLIRAYRKQWYRILRLEKLLNHNQKFILANMSANRWLNMRLECLGAIVMLSTSFFAVGHYERIGPELIGFALNYAFTITASLSIVILVYSEAEKSFLSVERVLEYTKITPERSGGIIDIRDRVWPEEGQIEYRNVTASYKEDLPAVLRNISFTIKPGQKVGIVGRTGSGKSSMILSLFRMIDIRHGKILIDGIDISYINLEKLRTSLAIIPQDPVLFHGTVRTNLDPFSLFSDEEIRISLRKAGLGGFSLQESISEGGGNLSAGQKQLLCLARALLLNTKILVLDEATASVDPHTDKIIQATIRDEFVRRTLLIIAHRLHTVIDADIILLLDNGCLIDCGLPLDLYERSGEKNELNLFRQLVDQYGDEAEVLVQRMRAKANSSPMH